MTMVREAIQTVYRYELNVDCEIDVSYPGHFGLKQLFNESSFAETSIADKTYTILLISALGVSVLILCLSWYVSGDPIFVKDAIKLPRFRHLDYNPIHSHTENGNGINHREAKKFRTEPLNGWRLWMGVLQNLVLLSLVAIHVVVLVTAGPDFLQIVFVVYWVRQLIG
jgi:hypothetical protein